MNARAVNFTNCPEACLDTTRCPRLSQKGYTKRPDTPDARPEVTANPPRRNHEPTG